MSEPLPTPEQEQPEPLDWDKLLLELERHAYQAIQMKPCKTWKAIAGFATAVAVVAGVIVGVAHLIR